MDSDTPSGILDSTYGNVTVIPPETVAVPAANSITFPTLSNVPPPPKVIVSVEPLKLAPATLAGLTKSALIEPSPLTVLKLIFSPKPSTSKDLSSEATLAYVAAGSTPLANFSPGDITSPAAGTQFVSLHSVALIITPCEGIAPTTNVSPVLNLVPSPNDIPSLNVCDCDEKSVASPKWLYLSNVIAAVNAWESANSVKSSNVAAPLNVWVPEEKSAPWPNTSLAENALPLPYSILAAERSWSKSVNTWPVGKSAEAPNVRAAPNAIVAASPKSIPAAVKSYVSPAANTWPSSNFALAANACPSAKSTFPENSTPVPNVCVLFDKSCPDANLVLAPKVWLVPNECVPFVKSVAAGNVWLLAKAVPELNTGLEANVIAAAVRSCPAANLVPSPNVIAPENVCSPIREKSWLAANAAPAANVFEPTKFCTPASKSAEGPNVLAVPKSIPPVSPNSIPDAVKS